MPILLDERTSLIEPMLRGVGRVLATATVTGVQEKAPMDLVTELDLTAERAVVQFLAEHFPDDGLLSEESSNSIAFAERLWILDPLDGTVNRTSGIPFFAISLALFVRGSPELGFIYDPLHDEMFIAQRHQGAYLNGRRIHVAQDHIWSLALTSNVIQKLAESAPAHLVTLLSRHGRFRGLGAQTLQLAYVAAGRIAAAISVETRLWDNAAGALLVIEAGGRYCDMNGRDPFPLSPNDPAWQGALNPCVASAPHVLEALLPLLSPLRL